MPAATDPAAGPGRQGLAAPLLWAVCMACALASPPAGALTLTAPLAVSESGSAVTGRALAGRRMPAAPCGWAGRPAAGPAPALRSVALSAGCAGGAVADRVGRQSGGPAVVLLRVAGDDMRRRARRGDFDASAEIPCAQEAGQALGTCVAGVARGAAGDAAVVVRFGNGFARTLYFRDGAFMSADATMSGVGTDTDWRVDGGTHFVRVDDQRYEIPATLLFGE